MPNEVRMYIIVRNDLESMTAGRAAAQASHAANHCIKALRSAALSMVDEWESQACNFGTTIVLEGDWEDQVMPLLGKLNKDHIGRPDGKLWYSLTKDPEYAVQDGFITHLVPLHTCMWIFGYQQDVEPYVEDFDLL